MRKHQQNGDNIRIRTTNDLSIKDSKRYYVKQRNYNSNGELSKCTYKCLICTREITQHCNVRNHIRMHLNIRPFSCSNCGKAFSTYSNCKYHIRKRVC